MSKEFLSLAHKIYMATENLTWTGGMGLQSFPFREEMKSCRWDSNIHWLISPVVMIDDMEMRLCASLYAGNIHDHTLRIFVDGELKSPGGVLARKSLRLFVNTWDMELSAVVRTNQGRSGKVKSPKKFMQDLENHIKGGSNAPVCALCKQALEEVESSLKGRK